LEAKAQAEKNKAMQALPLTQKEFHLITTSSFQQR